MTKTQLERRKEYQREYRRKEYKLMRDVILERHKKYAAANKETYAARAKAYRQTEVGRELQRLCAKRDHIKFKYKHVARGLLREAVRKGSVIKPTFCTSCLDSTKKIEGHHEDYSKPLEVVWLCRACHVKVEAKLRADRQSKDSEEKQ